MFMNANRFSLLFCIVFTATQGADAQDYKFSVVGTDFDFITAKDPSAFAKLQFVEENKAEMPDKRGNAPLLQQAYVFEASFTDTTKVRIFIDGDFESRTAAETEAMRYVHGLGTLPTALRQGVSRLVVHQGGPDTTAFSDEGLIVMYADNATKRISTHDLEETIFHESVHAAWDKKHANSKGWKQAQAADDAFVTVYASKNPRHEDLAESVLFAYTLLHHPERIDETARKRISATIPNRIKYVVELIPPGKPIFYELTKDGKPPGRN